MSAKRIFPFIALLYLILVAALIVRVPPGSAPDEAAHADYVKYIASESALPVFQGAPPPQYGYEFHQPPLYYALCAPGATLFQGDDLFLWCRAVSALCGFGVLILIWRAARRLFPERDGYAVLATSVAAVWPLHLGVSASAGNDALAGLFSAALFYLVARGSDGWQPRHALLAGVFAGLGLWTKTTTLPVSLAVLGLSWNLVAQGKSQGRGPLKAPLLVVMSGFLGVSLPLFIRNFSLYGDPLGWQAFSQAATAGTPGYPQMSVVISFTHYARGILLILFCTMWGLFGGPNSAVMATRPLAPTPRALPGELLPLAAICTLATIIVLLGAMRLRDEETLREAARALVARWWVFGLILITLGWAQFAYAHFSGGQARYLHPALLPLCVLGAASWNTLLKGRASFVAALFFWFALLILSLMNIFVWRTLV
jgi:hypothetical protein